MLLSVNRVTTEPRGANRHAPPGGLGRVAHRGDRIVVSAAIVLTGLGITAVVLGWLGQMRPVTLVVLGAALSTALVRLSRHVDVPISSPSGGLVHVVLFVFVAAFSIANAAASSEHLLTDSDPGIYANAARYLADEGTLIFEPAAGPFDEDPTLERHGGGQYDIRDDGRIYFQFFHFLTGLMAIGGWIGGNLLLLRLPALLCWSVGAPVPHRSTIVHVTRTRGRADRRAPHQPSSDIFLTRDIQRGHQPDVGDARHRRARIRRPLGNDEHIPAGRNRVLVQRRFLESTRSSSLCRSLSSRRQC